MTTDDNSARRVLVTGAAGFIGSHVVEHLLDDGQLVCGIDNFDPFYGRPTKEANLERARSRPDFRFVEGDLRDSELLRGLFADFRPDAVIHLAAKAGVRPSMKEPAAYYANNVMGTVGLLEAMRAADTRAFVFASSSSVYGVRGEGRPFSEKDDADHPVSPYAATKRAGEMLCHTYSHLHGISCMCLRLFTVYGPRQRPDLAIHKFARLMAEGQPVPVYGDGAALRDYTYVDDTVDAVCRALDRVATPSETPGFDVLNVGAGQPISVNRLVGLLSQALGREPAIQSLPEQPGDVPRTWADISRARAVLGYEPAVSIEDGLRRFVAWFHEQDERALLS